jgi:hypothetical protein
VYNTIIDKPTTVKRPTTVEEPIETIKKVDCEMSIAVMTICKDGICCLTDSRVLDQDKQIVSDEEYKSTLLTIKNGDSVLVAVTGSGQINDSDIISSLNQKFNGYSMAESDIEEILHKIAVYVRQNKDDDLWTSLIFGYYLNGKPHLAYFGINQRTIECTMTSSCYVISGEGIAKDKLGKEIDSMLNLSVDDFRHSCTKVIRKIIEDGKSIPNYSVGGYINIIAIDENGCKQL